MENKSFDFELIKPGTVIRIRHGETLLGKNGVLTPLLAEFLKAALEIELEAPPEATEEVNVENRIEVLRVKLNRQITALNARGGSYNDIRGHLANIYDRDVSKSKIRNVFVKHKGRASTDKRKIQ